MTDIHLPQGPFWRINIGQVLSGTIVVIVFFIGFGRMSEKFDSVIAERKEDRLRIDRMDQNGTVASQNKINLEALSITDLSQRTAKIEDAISNIKVMQEQIFRIGQDVKEIKDGGGKKP